MVQEKELQLYQKKKKRKCHVTDSLSVIFHTGQLIEAVIGQNLLILTAISVIAIIAGLQIFQVTGKRFLKEID